MRASSHSSPGRCLRWMPSSRASRSRSIRTISGGCSTWGRRFNTGDPIERSRLPWYSGGGQPAADAVGIQVGLGYGFPGGLLALKLLELRLGVKEVDVAWTALHDQVNHRLRPGLEMRGPGLRREGVLARFRWSRSPVQVLA